MKKSLLTFVLLAIAIMVGAANQDVQKKVAAKLSKTAPVALKAHKVGAQKIAKSPRKADATAIDLYFNTEDYSYKWYDGDEASFWYLGVNDDSGEYLLRIAYNTDEQTGTVNYDDLNLDYSYLNYFPENPADGEDAYQEITYEEGTTFTIAEDDECVTVTGTIIGGNGKTYAVHVNCMKPQPETYDIEGKIITQADYYEEDHEWYVRFKDVNDAWKITLDLVSDDDSFAGTYTMADAYDPDYCFAEDLNEDEDYNFTEMNVTVTMPEGITNPKEGCEITGTAKDANGNTFNFHMLKEAPIKPKEVKNIDVDVVTAEWPSDRNGGSYYELTEKSNPLNMWTLSLNELTGEAVISPEEFVIDTEVSNRTNTDTGEVITIDNGSITQTFDSETLLVNVDVALVMSDSIQYNYSFSVPAAKNGEETITFHDLAVDTSYSEWGSTSFSASTDNVALSVELTDYAQYPDEYTGENFTIGLDVWEDGMDTYISSLALINASTELAADDSPILHAKFLGNDGVIYTIEANYVEPVVTDTLHLTKTENVQLGDYTEYGDGFYFYSEDDDNLVWVKMETDHVTGHFTMDDLNPNCYIAYVTESGMPKYLHFSKGEFDVTRDGRTYKLDGTCQAGKYFVYLTMEYEMEGLDYDDYDNDVDVTFAQADITDVVASEDDGYNYVYVRLLNKERNDELCMVFFPEEFNGTSIPAGDYEISSYGWGNWVQAGQPDGTSIYPSFYAKLNDDGYVETPLWYLASGTVTVTEDEGVSSFEVDAKNSYSRTVHATFEIANGVADGISNVKTEKNGVSKVIENNQIVIKKGDKKYNVVGQRK